MEITLYDIVNYFQYNSIVVLSYFFICMIIVILDKFTKGKVTDKFFRTSNTSWFNPMTYFRMFSHSLGHSNWKHFSGNFLKILLIGPMLEEKYGSMNLLIMLLITSGMIGLLNRIFCRRILVCGASGIVFMMIVLSSFVGTNNGKIPLTLILILIFFVVDEIINWVSKKEDNTFYMGHVIGAFCGLAFGIMSTLGISFVNI